MKQIDWNELSETTKLVLPKSVKITQHYEDGCSVLMFEPEKKVKVFAVGEIVKGGLTGDIFRLTKEYIFSFDNLSKTTTEEKNDFLFNENKMLDENGCEVRWKPKESDEYFTPGLLKEEKFTRFVNSKNKYDKYIIDNNLAFSTPELATKQTNEILNFINNK